MKSKELMTHNLPEENQLISQIDARPTSLFVFLIMVSLFSFLINIPKAYGVILLIYSISCLIYMPRVILMEFYNEYMVIYNKADKTKCVLVYYEDVISWYYSRGSSHDYLYIELEDGKQVRVEAFSKSVFESNMNRFLKEKKRKNPQ